ncbi:uncharacterized protein [Medicago truncatula]|uniref:uncharacterized protein n=1 Tax=Medicago truncatula TaxID=3880 RepID=UPI000D2F3439|nr:uncharacterized protein LOC112418644 [Medicago truncatula]
MYKVLAKILANRLRTVIRSVVSDSQSGFVKGRQILDGILVANEAVDEARRLKKEMLLFKRKWMSECVGTATAYVLVNRCPTDEFPMERGLRQGDPLSPFLFMVSTEGINVLMNSLMEAGLFQGYDVGRENNMSLSHLQFADDTLIIGQKSGLNVRSIRAVLLILEQLSRLKVNFQKSMLTGVNVSNYWLSEATRVLHCRVGAFPFVYLGLPIGGDPRKLDFWRPILTCIISRLSNWKSKFLSFGGRLILQKSVMSSVPVYFLSFFKASTGVRRLREFNVALLGKWCWRMLVDTEGLWYRVLNARYGEEGGRLKEGRSDSSVWWRMLSDIRSGVGLGERGWFEENVRRVVGGGSSTYFWMDNWVGGVPLHVRFPRLFDLAENKWVTVSKMAGRGWVVEGDAWVWQRRLLVWEEELVTECSSLLCNIVLQDHVLDRWRLVLDPINGYSVKGTYQYLTRADTFVERGLFDAVWLKQAPLKVSIFVWRLFRNRLPTKDNLIRREPSITKIFIA